MHALIISTMEIRDFDSWI